MIASTKTYLTRTQKKKIERFRDYLKVWKRGRKRTFPWRKNPTPYDILIAEFFLQRTKALQAERQYKEFMKEYPSFRKLSIVKRGDVSKYMIPLGLKKRVPMMIGVIKTISGKYNGRIPTNYEDLVKLTGVGDYTANAVCVFALNESAPLIDANTIKVFSQLFNKKISREEGKRSKFVRACAEYFSSLGNPRLWNWVLLDFGAEGSMDGFLKHRKDKRSKIH